MARYRATADHCDRSILFFCTTAVLAVLCWGGHARSRHEETGFLPKVLLLLLLLLLKSITHQLWSRLRSLSKSCFQEAYLFLLKRTRRMKLYCRIMGFVSNFITHWQSLLLLCGTKPTILLSKHVPLCAVTAWFTTHSSSPRSPDHPYQS